MQMLSSSIHLLVPYCLAATMTTAGAAASAAQLQPHVSVPVDFYGGARAATVASRKQVGRFFCMICDLFFLLKNSISSFSIDFVLYGSLFVLALLPF